MGCFCDLFCPSKKRIEIGSPYEPLRIKENEDNNSDLEKKKELAEYLILNGLFKFKILLEDVRGLNPEQFNKMFEGDKDYKSYNIPRDKESDFLQLVGLFEENKEITSKYYSQNKYYSIILDLWTNRILSQLKKANGDNARQEKILEGINRDNWDSEFRDYFNSLIKSNPTSDSAEVIKNIIKKDFPALDELIKVSEKCKNDMAKNDNSRPSMILQSNIETQSKEFLKEYVTNFFKNNKEDILKIDLKVEDFAKKEAIKQMMKSGVSESKCKEIAENLIKKYKAENFTGTLNTIEGFEKVENVTLQFKNGLLDTSFKNKVKIIAGDELIQRVVLSSTILNVSYSFLYISQKLLNYKNFREQLLTRFDKIERNFNEHKSKLQILPNNVDEAIKIMQKVYADFIQDRNDIIDLIDDIDSAIKQNKTQRNEEIFNLVKRLIGTGTNLFMAYCSKGEKFVEYAEKSISEALGTINDVSNILAYQVVISDLKKTLNKAKNLQEKINKEIEELQKAYNNLKNKY